MGSALKKTVHAAEQDRPDVAAAHLRWRRDQATLDPTKLVFTDETWAKTNMARLHGRCAKGQRLVWPRYPTAIGRPPPSSPAFATTRSRRHW